MIWGRSYKVHLGIDYIKNGLSKLNFIMNLIKYDVIYVTTLPII